MPDTPKTPVIFRLERAGETWTPVAFFPTLPGTNDPWTCEIYAHLGQHGSASRDYYSKTCPITLEDAEPLKKELESIGYDLDVYKRWTPAHDIARFS